MNGVTKARLQKPRQAAIAIEEFWRTGRMVRSQWRHHQRLAEVSNSARAAVRLQALARGVISRRETQDAKEAATTRTSEAWGASAGTQQGRNEAVRRAVEAVNMAYTEVEGYACGTPLRWRDEALRRSTSAVGIQSAVETASAFGPRRCAWYCRQSQAGRQGLRGSVKSRKVSASRMAVAKMAQR